MVEADGGARDAVGADPLNPQRVFWELSTRLARRAILSADSGSAANWYARDVKIREGMMASLSGTLATMGPGVPYAIGAKFAHPDRPVIALVGDGAMQMNGINELITIAKYWEQWTDPAPDRAGAQQQRPQPGHLGAAGDGGRPQVRGLPGRCPTSPTRATRSCSACAGSASTTPTTSGGAWDQALAADRPVVLEAVDRSRGAAAAAAHHDRAGEGVRLGAAQGRPARAARILKQSFKQKIDEFVPGG